MASRPPWWEPFLVETSGDDEGGSGEPGEPGDTDDTGDDDAADDATDVPEPGGP